MTKTRMKSPKGFTPAFRRSLLGAAVLYALIPGHLYAQEAEEAKEKGDEEKAKQDAQVIEVVGIRQNLNNAQVMKREANTVVDVLSAKDASQLPDRSVLEALSRVPGLAIGRFAGANDPDHFGVEGTGLTMRGLSQARSEFNGRDVFQADSGRGLGFEDVPPELMGSVVVYKNQTADMIEGGIAGTVSLNTKKPFDSQGQLFAFTLDSTYGDMREDSTPSASMLYSNQWDTSSGRWGFLVSLADSELKAQSEGVQIGRLDLDENLETSGPVYVPRTMRLTQKKDDRERQGGSLAVQWENVDKTVALTTEFIHSDSKLAWTEQAMEMADDSAIGSLGPVTGTQFGYNSAGVFTNGLITSNAGWRGNDPTRQPGGEFGAQHALVSRYREDNSTVNDFSINLRFRPTDRLTTSIDYQLVKADADVLDFSVMGATRAVVGLQASGVPQVDLHDPAYNGSQTHFTDPHQYFWRSAMDHISDNDGKEQAIRLDAEYALDGWFKSVESGVRFSKRDQTTRQTIYNWGHLSEAWAGGGNDWFDSPAAAHLVGDIQTVNWDGFARGGVLNIAGGNNVLFPSLDLARNYGSTPDRLDQLGGGWMTLAERNGAEGHFLPNEINHTVEESDALYAKFNFESVGHGLDYRGNFGLRYVKMENRTDGFLVFPDDIPTSPTDVANFLPADQRAFGNASSTAESAKNDFDKILPSLNVAFDLENDVVLRLAYSQAIALPQLGNLRNYVSIQGDDLVTQTDGMGNVTSARYERYTAKSGNPYLKPMEADNYDLTAEWYFSDAGSLAFAAFHKDVENYFINGTSFREYTNNGSTQTVEVAGATNGGKGRISGFEIAYQQFFDFLPEGWNGLGVQFNYTYIDEKGSPNANLAPDKPDSTEGEGIAFDDLPLEGLSKDNLNLTLMYEKYGITARLAYNYRSDYLLTTKDVITSLPIFAEERGQLDASVFYYWNDKWGVGLQATNLTDEWTETSMQYNEEGDRATRAMFRNDVRYSFVLRGGF